MCEWTVCFQMNQSVIDPEFVARIEAVAEEFGVSIDSKSWPAQIETDSSTNLDNEKKTSNTDWKFRLDDFRKRVGHYQKR